MLCFGFLMIGVGYLLPRSTWLLFCGRAIELRALGRRSALWGLAALISFGVSTVKSSYGVAGERAIITAVHRYHDERGRYPETLDELVPRFLPSVPRSRRTPGLFRRFEYDRYGDDAHLTWYLIPPFGRPFYVFNQRRHGYLD